MEAPQADPIELQTGALGRFTSIETIDPTTISVYPDRVVLSGGGRSEPRITPLEEVARVKVRTLLGVSTLLIRTVDGGTMVADLFARDRAEAAAALLKNVRSGLAGVPAA